MWFRNQTLSFWVQSLSPLCYVFIWYAQWFCSVLCLAQQKYGGGNYSGSGIRAEDSGNKNGSVQGLCSWCILLVAQCMGILQHKWDLLSLGINYSILWRGKMWGSSSWMGLGWPVYKQASCLLPDVVVPWAKPSFHVGTFEKFQSLGIRRVVSFLLLYLFKLSDALLWEVCYCCQFGLVLLVPWKAVVKGDFWICS